jgi:sporulation protein YlmC with PRC-barrel domain
MNPGDLIMKLRSVLSAGVCLTVLAAIALTSIAQESRVVYKFSDLRGRDVRNMSNENLGEIEDMVANVKTGDINYFALSHGEVLGFGGKLFAISPRAIALSGDRKHFVSTRRVRV